MNNTSSAYSRRAARSWGRRHLHRHLDGPPRRPVAPFLFYALGSVPEFAGLLAAVLVNVTLSTGGGR